MPLVALDHVSLAYGHLPLLDEVALQIEPGERVCTPRPERRRQVDAAAGARRRAAARHGHRLAAARPARRPARAGRSALRRPAGLRRRRRRPRRPQRPGERVPPCRHRAGGGAHAGPAGDARAGCSTSSKSRMAGGWNSASSWCWHGWAAGRRRSSTRSRAAGAGACCSPGPWWPQPDLLLLDEPTNHLDIEAIELARELPRRLRRRRRVRHARPGLPPSASPPASSSSIAAG